MNVRHPSVSGASPAEILARKTSYIMQQLIRIVRVFGSPKSVISMSYKKSLFHFAKVDYKDSLRALSYVEESDQDGLRRSLRHHAVSSAIIVTITQWMTRVGVLLWVPPVYIAIHISNELEYNENQWLAFLVTLVALVTAFGISVSLTRIIHWTPIALMAIFAIAFLVPGSILIVRHLSFGQSFSPIPHATDGQALNIVLDGALIYAGTTLAIGVSLIVAYVALALTVFRQMKRRPDVVMVDELLEALLDLETCGARLGDVDFRASVFGELEAAAYILERAIPHATESLGLEARRKFDERCRSGALELRTMQARFALMDENGVESVKRDIVRYIKIVTQGKYGLLPVSPPVTHKKSKRLTAARIIKTAFIALLPIACLVSARYAGLKLYGQFSNWAIIAALGWTAITVISILDPFV